MLSLGTINFDLVFKLSLSKTEIFLSKMFFWKHPNSPITLSPESTGFFPSNPVVLIFSDLSMMLAQLITQVCDRKRRTQRCQKSKNREYS